METMNANMKKTIVETSCMEDTAKYAYEMASKAQPGQVYALIGDLGVGKTVFTKGFARGLGIEEPVSSPTFTILQIYEEGRLPLYHFDVYRIEEPEEMEEIGLDEYIDGDGVCLIEWAGRIEELLPEDVIVVFIEKDLEKGLDYRRITVRQR
jgi:tRNA threonylcarbamoyladenosine biosynthesis protein TsaE